MITRSTFLRALAAGAVVTPIAAACGGKKKVAATPTTVPATTTTSTTLAPTTTTAASTTTTAAATTTTIPAKVYPFTGLPVTNEANFERPALAVKVNNAAAARPQAGLNQADIVIEEIVEGITRFMAVFHSTDCEKIGSIRSARNTDADLLRGLGTPLFAWSGANDGVIAVVRGLDNVTDIGYDKYGGELYTTGRRLADYTEFFISTSKAYGKTPPGSTTPAPIFTYRKAGEAPTGGKDIEKLNLQLSGTRATWNWSKEKSAWLRDTDGRQHDDLDGEQLSPANVVIAFTRYEFSNGSPVAYSVGDGVAWVLTAGKIVKGTWERLKATDPYTLLDADKKPIGLTPGRTFLELPFTAEADNEPQV
jgi:Protein of unknown function (DUF3048) N-terminal domain/Protein of unknown function (DUF3048) C-terminal domain